MTERLAFLESLITVLGASRPLADHKRSEACETDSAVVTIDELPVLSGGSTLIRTFFPCCGACPSGEVPPDVSGSKVQVLSIH